MKRVSIAFVIDSLYGGGAEKAVLTLALALNRDGHRAHVISLEDVVHYEVARQNFAHWLPGRGKNLLGLQSFRRQARRLQNKIRQIEDEDKSRFDAVVAHLPVAYKVVSLCGFPSAYYCVQVSIAEVLRQARLRGPLQMIAQRLKWRALDGQRVLAVSRGVQREIENLSFINPASVRTIHNPIDIDKIQRQALQKPAGIPQGPYVLHAGRAARQKRLDLLFEAFRHVAPPVKLVMLTNHPDRVARLAATFGLADRVVVKPFQQNPYAWMARARLLVLSSDFEGMSMVAMEALACGTPVVSTDCPHGMDEILTGELGRWLVPVGNDRELGARINEALQTHIDASAAEILRKVDVRVIAQQYVELVSSRKAA